MFAASPPLSLPETHPLKTPDSGREEGQHSRTRYGSIIATPPLRPEREDLPALELPDPALDPGKISTRSSDQGFGVDKPSSTENKPKNSDAFHVGATHKPHKYSSLPRQLFHAHRTSSAPGIATGAPRRALIKRMFSTIGTDSPRGADVSLEIYKELDVRQGEFFTFLDQELDKIESFHKQKEQEASDRLHVLRDQLHEMRDRRLEEVNASKPTRDGSQEGILNGLIGGVLPRENDHGRLHGSLGAVVRRKPQVGKTTKAMGTLGSPSAPRSAKPEDRGDYTRRVVENHNIPYHSAKRKLKLALQEFYRGLELLKSYAILNRTAFRKCNKKYDKAVNARPTGRYMSEKVNKAYFVQSDVVEGHLVAVEDLYARYFERGSRKTAVNKLRSKSSRLSDYSPSTFRDGFFIAAGLALGIQGVIYGSEHLKSPDPSIVTVASYLLQLYAGYFLGLLLFLLFVLDCRLWASARINYAFIFEFDTRHVLDWRQLAELPSLFFFLLGLFIWLNFQQDGASAMFRYWPVVLVGVTLLILSLPLPIVYHRARKWWAYSCWRLFFAGIYPVEFRDFFLGDMFCSQTYAMGNIALFFCLYARDWNNPPQCNSNHSRLQGFFQTLPSIWRALQCIRRYHDSRNWFPHLANCGKYTCGILFYMALSLFRIHRTSELRALFITLGALNATYCSTWDVIMDWSLGNPYAQYPLLRDHLAVRRVWVYYLALVLDPIFRFSWIFYAIYSQDLQHSALLSFWIGLAEVGRRGMWTVFRVENEHCTNVERFRASRDIPLPYSIPPSPSQSDESRDTAQHRHHTPIQASTGVDVEAAPSPSAPSPLRQRRSRTSPLSPPRGLQRVGTIIHAAHAQDFERKKRPRFVDGQNSDGDDRHDDDDSTDDDEGDAAADGEMSSDREEVNQVERLVSNGRA